MSLRRKAGAAALAVITAGCGSAGDDGPDPGSPPGGAVLSGEVLVSAAASLTDAFADLESAFEAAHPALDVRLNLGGSSSLRVQILEGAPVDVFAAASPAHMEPLLRAGRLSGEPRIFAHNRLRIAVPAGNPAGVEGLDDFADDALLVGLCAEGVPCGDFARQALAEAGVRASPDTHEPDVRALLTKIELGELDAGITYVTDVAATGGAVEGIDLPADVDVVAEYPVAVLAGAPNPPAARALVEFVLSDRGRAILARRGFGVP